MSRSAKLHALQQTDTEIDQLCSRLSEVKSLLGETEELRSARVRLQDTESELLRYRTRQRQQDLALQDLERKKKSSEQRLYGGKIRNPKELTDLQEEIASLHRRMASIEDQLLETMMKMDEWDATLIQANENLEHIETSWTAAQHDLVVEQEALENRLAELDLIRQRQVAAIPAADVSSYEHLRPRKRGTAVAILDGAECQGCMTSVSAARVKQARSESLAFCGTCGRILHAVTKAV
jgi:predicted  nucleic acid-binding Zn-ribbon protein